MPDRVVLKLLSITAADWFASRQDHGPHLGLAVPTLARREPAGNPPAPLLGASAPGGKSAGLRAVPLRQGVRPPLV